MATKRCRRNRETPKEEEEDRISSLQDDLVCRILSLLPTKNTVATSALSTRWRHLYASVTDLSFVDSPNGSGFVSFVSDVISAVLSKSKYIRKLSINGIHGTYTCSVVASWISAVLGPNLQELKIFHMVLTDPVPLPPQIFHCRSLTSLKLIGPFTLCVPEHVLFPSLKFLILSNLRLPDHVSLMRFFSGCVVLEGLSCSCYIDSIGVLEVSIPSLKHLNLYFINGDDELLLNTPNLESVRLDGYVAGVYSGGTLNSLVGASLEIQANDGNFSYGKVSRLIDMVSNATSLMLEGASMTFLINQTRRFNKLTHLSVSSACFDGLLSLPNILTNAPHLEVIEFFYGLHGQFDELFLESVSFLTNCVPDCVSAHLKEVKIGMFYGEEVEFEIVEYFLKNAKVLEKMIISPNLSWDSDTEDYVCTSEDQLSMTRRLLELPRLSSSCQIVFDNED